jgi:glutamate/tyrosine decarboxylase-like PLP-dependent enzyme
MLAARAQAIKILKQQHPFVEEGHLLSKLMAYCSKEAHSCVEKAAMISFVKLRILEPDSNCSLRSETLTKVSEFYFPIEFSRLSSGLTELASRKPSRRRLTSNCTCQNKLNFCSTQSVRTPLKIDFTSQAMEEDELQGLIPFFVSTTLGTTGSCSFDALDEIGQALQRFPNVWLHVDAAYAGNAFICPELKPLLKVKVGKMAKTFSH